MKLVESFAKRLEIAMNLRGVRAVDIVEHTGVSASKISHYLKGDYEPKQTTIYKLAVYLRVSEAWLIGYDVDMERFEPTLEGSKKEIMEMLDTLDNKELELVKSFIKDYFINRK